jgi:hypothetical protein
VPALSSPPLIFKASEFLLPKLKVLTFVPSIVEIMIAAFFILDGML